MKNNAGLVIIFILFLCASCFFYTLIQGGYTRRAVLFGSATVVISIVAIIDKKMK